MPTLEEATVRFIPPHDKYKRAEGSPHPSSQRWADVAEGEADRGTLLNTLFRHTGHAHATCLRPAKFKKTTADDKTAAGIPECRFKFPKELRNETVVEVENLGKDRCRVHVHLKRNDQLLNQGNPTMQNNWRANCDVQIVTDPVQVTRYILKYCTKSEKSSITGAKIMKTAMTGIDAAGCDYPGKRCVRKMLMTVVGQRDISTAEASHLLFSTPMTCSSEEFVIMSLCNDRKMDKSNDGVKVQANLLDVYASRLTQKGLRPAELGTL